MIEWKDTTSYRQGDTERIPRSWEAQFGVFRVVVHRNRCYGDDVWLMSTTPALFDCYELKSPIVEEARCQAVSKLQSKLQDVLFAIEQAVG